MEPPPCTAWRKRSQPTERHALLHGKQGVSSLEAPKANCTWKEGGPWLDPGALTDPSLLLGPRPHHMASCSWDLVGGAAVDGATSN